MPWELELPANGYLESNVGPLQELHELLTPVPCLQLTTLCSYSSMGANALFCSLQVAGIHVV